MKLFCQSLNITDLKIALICFKSYLTDKKQYVSINLTQAVSILPVGFRRVQLLSLFFLNLHK